jgi:hypothetical protein
MSVDDLIKEKGEKKENFLPSLLKKRGAGGELFSKNSENLIKLTNYYNL